MDSYLTVGKNAQAEFVEKKSRFIGSIMPVESEEAAQEFLAGVRAAHREASHNCYAYLLRQGQIQRYSDDGEPQGTAGIPMLDVLRKEGLWNVAVVVTRYFGGTLLGAGGLVRAYSHTARLAVDAGGRVEMCPCVRAQLTMPYPQYGKVSTLLQQVGVVVSSSDFTDAVALELLMKAEMLAPLQRELTEWSGGTLFVEVCEELFARYGSGMDGQESQ